uniref:Uncharacterized protein n=1 Tax=Biomphalaria glabrata TaxID=6526 RepID=A0A2C9M1Q6_BIOGL
MLIHLCFFVSVGCAAVLSQDKTPLPNTDLEKKFAVAVEAIKQFELIYQNQTDAMLIHLCFIVSVGCAAVMSQSSNLEQTSSTTVDTLNQATKEFQNDESTKQLSNQTFNDTQSSQFGYINGTLIRKSRSLWGFIAAAASVLDLIFGK